LITVYYFLTKTETASEKTGYLYLVQWGNNAEQGKE
jgi:hypothetical protein